ncbi:HAD family hydrolase [Sedimentibacter hydroxybenzoicus DSM 7310]|uniref:HAD family hydrolase n=1 Tax=Sedimentibacter hydroxybenzoicus DSM 7310 TaxID=1123245 RepID=A0A974GVS4_SEDHY|nr:HAD family hydrolase [Sedimentibacter hydroxybenzoicus]NYB73673.1 HAD family hydrolase [Sedimentibacter hydroxybenzoicus DSM 7310]
MKEKINTILFDLDGTLLPIYQDEFIKSYFSRLAARILPMGFEKDAFVKAIMAGMEAMIDNDGTRTNAEAFWEIFERLLNVDREQLMDMFLDFYKNEFDEVKEIVTERISRREMIDNLRERGYTLVLATNPMFPIEAVATRLAWIQLSPEDFSLVTTFDNCRYCKPSVEYFQDILSKLNKKAEECIMIGNNTLEDMICEKIGIKAGLVTNNLENKNNYDINQFAHGTIEEVLKALL